MINGVIVQKDINSGYKGVEGDNWYLNDLYPDTFRTDFENRIEKAWYDNNFVDVCSFDSFLKLYVKLSQKNNIPFRILLCETEKTQPICEMDFGEKHFIGYDYAYAGGSYYSAVFNDLFARKLECFSNIQLNNFGLINDLQQLNRYIDERNAYKKILPKATFESGGFIIYKLYEVPLELLLE